MTIPYCDLAGFQRLTKMPPDDVALVEARRPGFIARVLRGPIQSHVNARLRKRYGLSLPFGQAQPQPTVSGTLGAPLVALSGVPVVGSQELVLKVTTAGVIGTAQLALSTDGGQTYGLPFASAASVPLAGTGITAVITLGTNLAGFALDNLYTCATPVPGQILAWMVAIATIDAYGARGVNAADPSIGELKGERDTALAQLLEAANGDTGLLEIPTNEDLASAVTTGGPQGYTEESPYSWTDVQRCDGRAEDQAREGTRYES